MEIWETVQSCIQEAVAKARNVAELRVVALGITNQRETTVAWDKVTGEPLTNAIVWLDGRTASICHTFVNKLGSGVSTVWSAKSNSFACML